MMGRRKPHEDIRFSAKKASGAGICSVGTSLLSILLFPAAVAMSCYDGGAGGPQIGAVGMLALIIGLIGLFTGISELHNEEANRKIPRMGIRIGAAAVLLWIVILVIGLRS